MTRADFRGLSLTLLFRLLVCAAVAWSGFEAVSDDDFARVVHALDWVEAPRVDATGTSWLPLPVWLYGFGFTLFGGGWFQARLFAVIGALVSSALLYLAARWFGSEPREATVAAVAASAISWSGFLGNAPVPELFAASCALAALASVSEPGEGPPYRRTLVGALLLLVATLCRYEPWLVVPWFVGGGVLNARRHRSPRIVLLALIAAAGPVFWLVLNVTNHGDAFHFIARVTRYRNLVASDGSSLSFDYLRILVFQEPELWLIALALLGLARRHQVALPRFRLRLFSSALLFLALSLAALRGGAATHHEGRALLFCWLAAALWAGQLGYRLLVRREVRVWTLSAALGSMLLGALILRPWFSRRDDWAARGSELALGEALRKRVPAGDVVLFDAADYGYFAVMTGMGSSSRLRVPAKASQRRFTLRDQELVAEALRVRATYLVTKKSLGSARRIEGYSLYAVSSLADAITPPASR